MAQSITIDIVANLKDNATDKAKDLDSTLEKLEKHKDIDLGSVKIETSSAMSKLEASKSKVDSFSSNKAQTMLSADTATFDSGVSKAQKNLETVASTKAEAKISLDTSEVTTGIKGVQNSVESVEVPIKIVSDAATGGDVAADMTKMPSARYVNKNNWGYSDSALEDIAEREMLINQASEYGLKHDKSASLQEMRELVWGYEDENFQAKDIDTTAENTKAVAASTKATQTASEAASETAEELGGDGGLGVFAKSMARRLVGAAAVAKGATNVMSDLTDAIEADNNNDASRSAARGMTKAGLMGAGAAIGSLIPGVGTLFGAGAGALIGSLFGDQIGDAISGIHKSAEELAVERLETIFGRVSMSAEDTALVAQKMALSPHARTMRYNQQQIDSGYSLQEDEEKAFHLLLSDSGKLAIQSNLGFKLDKEDVGGYQSQISSYTDAISELYLQQMYNSFMNNDSLYGYGNWDTNIISDKFKSNYEEFLKGKNALEKYVKKALADGNLTYDEMAHVTEATTTMHQKAEAVVPKEADVASNTFGYLSAGGFLSQDSWNNMRDSLWDSFEETAQNAVETMSRSVLEGTDRSIAENAMWANLFPDFEKSLHTDISATQGKFVSEITGGRESYMSQANHFLSDAADGWKASSIGVAPVGAAIGGDISAGNLKSWFGFGNVEAGTQKVLADEWDKHYAKNVGQWEKLIEGGRLHGQDVSQTIGDLMGAYEIGAMGGNAEAIEKYAAARMFATDALRDKIGKAMETDPNSFDSNFKKTWDMLSGAGDEVAGAVKDYNDKTTKAWEDTTKDVTDAVEKDAKETSEAIEKNTDTKNDAADKAENTDASEKAEPTPAPEAEPGEDMEQAAKELGNNTMEAVAKALDPANLDFKKSGIGESLMSAIGESLSGDNLQDVDFGSIDIGSNIMDAVSNSISSENLADFNFSESNIGENIMQALTASLSEGNFNLEGIDIGSNIMNAISTSFDGMTFEGLDIGSNLMNAISQSIASADMGEVSIGSQIMDSISASFDGADFSGIDIGSKIADSINTSMAGITITLPEIEMPEIEVPELEGTINYTANFEGIEEAPQIEGIAHYTTTFESVADAPELSGTVNYVADFEGITDPPGLDGVVSYTADFSGIGEPPTLSGVVNYKGNFSGISAPTLTGTVNYSGGVHHATGTNDAAGGWAYVNDDGSSDPRELIEHNGEFRMYEGRDVLTYLEPHDKVYTSAQTKAILGGSVPHYASGKNNKMNAPIAGRGTAVSDSSVGSVSIGGVTVSIAVETRDGASVVDAIAQHYDEIASGVTERLAKQIMAINANVPVRG